MAAAALIQVTARNAAPWGSLKSALAAGPGVLIPPGRNRRRRMVPVASNRHPGRAHVARRMARQDS